MAQNDGINGNTACKITSQPKIAPWEHLPSPLIHTFIQCFPFYQTINGAFNKYYNKDTFFVTVILFVFIQDQMSQYWSGWFTICDWSRVAFYNTFKHWKHDLHHYCNSFIMTLPENQNHEWPEKHCDWTRIYVCCVL